MYENFIDKIIFNYLSFTNKNLDKVSLKINTDLQKNITNIIKKTLSEKKNYNLIIKYTINEDVLYTYIIPYLYIYLYSNIYISNFKDINSLKQFILTLSKHIKFFNNSNNNLYITNTIEIYYDLIEKNKDNKFLFKNKNSIYIWNNIKDTYKIKKLFDKLYEIINYIYHKANRKSLFFFFFNSQKLNMKNIYVLKNLDLSVNNINKKNIFQIFNDKSNIIYNFCKKYEKNIKYNIFNELLNNKLLYFISSDFIRYNKIEYKYNEILQNNNNRKSKRKINILINLINLFSKYNNSNLSIEEKNNQLKLLINKDRMLIASNYIEEIKILKRLYDETNSNIIKNEFYNKLLYLQRSPFSNFEENIYSSISIKFNKSKKIIRFSTINELVKQKITESKKTNIQFRNSIPDYNIDIVGFYFPSYILSNKIKIKYDLNIDIISEIINKSFFNKLDESNFFIFYNRLNTNLITQLFEKILKIYIEIIIGVYKKVLNNYSFNQNIIIINNIKYSNYLISNIYNKLISYNLKIHLKKIKYIVDKNDKNWINFNFEKIKQLYLKNKNKSKKICQHVYDYKYLKNIHHLYFSNYLDYFTKKYVQHIHDNNNLQKIIICSSCKEKLNISDFIKDDFLPLLKNTYVNINELDEFNKYNDFIKFLQDKIQYFSNTLNFNYKSNLFTDILIKQIIYLIKYNHYFINYYVSKDKEFILNYINKLNIDKSILYPIDIDYLNNKLLIDTNEKNILILNTIYAYIVTIFIININTIDLFYIKINKTYNINSFNKWKKILFNKYNILINTLQNINNILKYDVLCYLIFICSSFLFKNKIWILTDNKKYDAHTHLEIISTIVNIINNISIFDTKLFNNLLDNELNIKNIDKISISSNIQYIKKLFYSNIYTFYSNNDIFKKLIKFYFSSVSIKETNNEIEKNIVIFDIFNLNNTETIYNVLLTSNNIYYYINKKNINLSIINPSNIIELNTNIKNNICSTDTMCKLDIYSLLYQQFLKNNKIFNKFLQEKISNYSIKYNYINTIYSKKSNNYIYNFLQLLQNKSQNKNILNINSYYITFTHLLKFRSNYLNLTDKDLQYINSHEFNSKKSIYIYFSKIEKIYYYFDFKTLIYIGYSLNGKKFEKVYNINNHKLQKNYSIIELYNYIGFSQNDIKNKNNITGLKLIKILKKQLQKIKNLIINFKKSLTIIFNNKSFSNNELHSYYHLKKYKTENILEKFDINLIFKNSNYLFIKSINNIKNLNEYLLNYNHVNFYLLYNLEYLINISPNKINISKFIYEYLSNYIENSTIYSNLKNRIFKSFLEYNKFKLFNIINESVYKNILTDDIKYNDEEVSENVREYEEDILNDTDNHEDDMLVSKND